jgi:hypothetical protein
MDGTYEHLGTTDALYCNNQWNAKADLWKCHICGGEFWSIPTVQKCLRIEQKCPVCSRATKKHWWQFWK